MENNLLVEISRIHQLMGVQNKTLIVEQGILPILRSFLKKGLTFEQAIDDAVELAVSTGKMTKAEADEAARLLKNETKLVDDIERAYKSPKLDLNTEIALQKRMEDLAKKSGYENVDKFLKSVKGLTQEEVNIITNEGVLKMISGNKFVKTQNSYDNVWVPEIIKMLKEGLDNPKLLLNITDLENMYEMFAKEMSEKFLKKWKKQFKIDNLDSGKISQQEYDKIIQNADKTVGEPVFNYFKKKFNYRNNSEITELVEKYKSLNKIDNGPSSIKKPSYGESTPRSSVYELDGTGESIFNGKVTDEIDLVDDIKIKDDLFPSTTPKIGDYIDEGVEETATEIISPRSNPFKLESKGGFATVELNFKFFEAFSQLKYLSTRTSTNPEIKKTLQKMAKAIRDGEKISWTLSEVEHLNKSGLNLDQIALIEERLKYPIQTKMGLLGEIFWRWIEPFVKKYREVILNSEYFRNLANKFGAKLPNTTAAGYFDDFLKTLELRLTKMNISTSVSEGEIKQLKDKFVRLRSELGESDQYYAQLWNDLNSYMLQNLDTKSLDAWRDLTVKLQNEQGSGWRYSSWKEIINDSNITKMADDAVLKNAPKESQDIFKNIMESSLLTATEKTTKGIFSWVKKNGAKLWTFFMTGSFRTPKEMMEYMISRGYATKAQGPFNITMTAGGANYLQTQLYKYIYIPLMYASLTTLIEAAGEAFSGLDLDGKSFLDGLISNLYKSLFSKDIIGYFIDSDSFKSQYPDWYKFIEPLYDVAFSSPANKILKRVVESQFIVDQQTPEEKAHQDLDKELNQFELELEKDGSKLGKEELARYKKMIENNIYLDNNLKNNVISNMSLESRIDPKLKEELHGLIKDAFEKNKGFRGKLTEIKEGLEAINRVRNSTPIDNILVTANGVRYLLFEEPVGSGYIYFYKPKYSEIINNPKTPKTTHNLNELVF